MEKRLFTFFVLSIIIWGGYLALQVYLSPPKPKDLVADNAPLDPEAQKAKVDNKQADDVELDRADNEKSALNAKPANNDTTPEEDSADVVVTTPRVRKTLGSLDPASGYALLVTLDSRGAAIERIEFNSRFHDLDDLSGYLGHLALDDATDGARVNVVGPGTPAALATGGNGSTGLQAGDVITAANEVRVDGASDLQRILEKTTKPDDDLALTVIRDVAGKPQTIAFTAKLIRRPLELIRPESNSGATAVDGSALMSSVGPPSFLLTLQQLGSEKLDPRRAEIAKLPSLYDSNWKITTSNDREITFVTTLDAKQAERAGGTSSLEISKTFRLATSEKQSTDPYHLDLEIDVKNTGGKAETVALRLNGPNGLPLEGWWYSNKINPGWMKGAGARDVRIYANGHRLVGNPQLISSAAAQVKDKNPPIFDLLAEGKNDHAIGYVAVDAQYFASALLPADALTAAASKLPTFTADAAYAAPLNVVKDKKWSKTTNVSFYIESEPEKLQPGRSLQAKYVVFAGPKDPEVLERYHLTALIEYGWFGWVSKTLRFVLSGLSWLTLGNYGIAIILLTVIVRLCLLPISIRQARSAAVMQQLQPEIVKLKEKYKDDLEKQATAQRELFAKHGFNPMAGCLPMLAQLPIFMGLYRTLATDINLREAALIPGIHWASNLAGPDQLFRWKEFLWRDIGDEAHGWLGPYCNVLPLITMVLFMVQQKLFAPPAVTEEQKMQANVMNFMTLFMGVMFYKVPAGLCIYFITSSLWGICERKLLKTPQTGTPAPIATTINEKNADRKESKAASAISGLFGMADAQLKSSKNIPSIRKKNKKD